MNKIRSVSKGFTLLELLVVVLIIGILAGIALPQYRRAVDKARVSKYLVMGKSIRDSQERYFLAKGNYTPFLEDLDMDSVISSCTKQGNYYIACDNGEFTIMSWGNQYLGLLSLHYCPKLKNTNYDAYTSCLAKQELALSFGYANPSPEVESFRNKTTCQGTTERGQNICKDLGF